MRKHLLRFLFLAALLRAVPPAAAQTVYLRTPATGVCNVTAATNATPIRITVSDISLCGITTAGGQLILVTEVRGNTAANIHLENAADTVNLARKTANVVGNSFDLQDISGNPVSGNGAYVNGGRVGLATAYTLRAHPRVYLDGPGGTITTSVSNTAAGGRAHTSNLPFTALKNAVNAFNAAYQSLWGSDRSGNKTTAAALRWMADGDAASRDSALFGVNNVTQVLGTPACDETRRGCYAPASSVQDYPTQYMENFSQSYSIVRAEMTPTERQRYVNFVLNDLPWNLGGIGYTGTSLVKPTWKVSNKDTSGTVQASGTTVTGTGTQFLTTVSVGDIIQMPHTEENVYAEGQIVTAVNSDTSLTVHKSVNIPAGSHYMVGPQWNDTMYGLMWFSKHYEASPLCGGATRLPDGFISACDNYGLQAGLEQSGTHNLVLARLLGYHAIGLSTCGDDPRGCLLLSLANEWFVDNALPRALAVWTGFSQSNPGYHVFRMYNTLQGIATMFRNSLVEQPDYFASTDIMAKGALWGIGGSHIRGLEFSLPNAEPGTYYIDARTMRVPLLSMFWAPTSTEVRQFKDWLTNRYTGYTESFIRFNSGEYVWWHFLYFDPQTVTLPAPTTNLFVNTNRARCAAIYGNANCPTQDGRYMATSSQNWTSTRTFFAFNGQSFACIDHCGDEAGGWPLIAKNGKALLAGDADNLMSYRDGRGYVELGGSSTNLRFYPEKGPVTVLWAAGNDDYMVANYDLTQTFKAAALASSVTRQMIHLKAGTQDYILDHARAVTTGATSIRGLQHFHLNECGSPSSSSCISFNRASATVTNTQTGAKLTSKALGIGGNITIDTQSGSETDGSYTSSHGKTFRWAVCPTTNGTSCTNATSSEWVVVHKPSTSAGDTLPPLVQSSSGPFRIVEIQDPSFPKVAAFTAAGATATSLSFTSTHTGSAQYVISGLTAGPYSVSVNGNAVGIFTATAGGNSIGFSATAGAVSIVPGPPPLTIATQTLPGAAIGKPYFETVTAFSSTTPYTWQLVGGNLCAGLTLGQVNNDAVIGGVAETLESCTFTLQVTNSNGSETDSREFTISTVEPGSTVDIASTWLPAGRVGDFYSTPIRPTGGTAPLQWTIIAGSLCGGLSLDSASGIISGTPAQVENCVFTVRVRDLGNETAERQFFIAIVENKQTPLFISSTAASFNTATVLFGRRGLLAGDACQLDLRLGGPSGSILTSVNSTDRLSRRMALTPGLPAGQIVHATATCGADTATTQFNTGFAPSTPKPVKFLLRPASSIPAADAVLFYGDTLALANSLVASCSGGYCTAMVDTAEPLLYWRATYRDNSANTLASTGIYTRPPR